MSESDRIADLEKQVRIMSESLVQHAEQMARMQAIFANAINAINARADEAHQRIDRIEGAT